MFDKVNDSGQHKDFSTGSKRDTDKGKGWPHLIPTLFLRRLSQHYQNGASKYGKGNWQKGQPLSRYIDAIMRHTWGFMEGDFSEDHLAAIAWNSAAIMWTIEEIAAGRLPRELDDMGIMEAYEQYKNEHTVTATVTADKISFNTITYESINTHSLEEIEKAELEQWCANYIEDIRPRPKSLSYIRYKGIPWDHIPAHIKKLILKHSKDAI